MCECDLAECDQPVECFLAERWRSAPLWNHNSCKTCPRVPCSTHTIVHFPAREESSQTSPSTQMQDLYPLRGLRGLCAMTIVVGHQLDFFMNGHGFAVEYLQAVTLFFLLSGIPLVRLHGHTTSLRMFYSKRLARLAPMYYLTLALNLGAMFLNYPEPAAQLWSNVRWSLIVSVLGLQSCAPQYGTVAGVLWQVSVFGFGYAIFPWVMRRIQQVESTQGLTIWFLVCWLGSCAVGIMFVCVTKNAMWGGMQWHFHILGRLPQFVSGLVVGQWLEWPKENEAAQVVVLPAAPL